jgi:hypothetical protein
MVEEGEETVEFRLCSCLSTLVSPEQGLEGKLADLRWDAIAVMEGEDPFSSSGMEEEKRRSCIATVFRTGYGLSLYIPKEVSWYR